ncbi:FHA domain-containing protein PS1 isoform X2 [Cryptomeria japonica]|uniref:FHA domain-containing protein PS1 isoform X2 n=1 Tax=Cryptomeria japonica TaxID=3369 RepID=UPI0027DAA1E9|nr:FHA domain-containing protein PS1 isoform X2 [Cryptomeria japonica]
MAVKEEEKEAFVPSLCVFKNGTFLNSIFLSDPELEENEEEDNGVTHEKILKMGRHPDCDIVVDHPSISRWHLQIQLQKSSQELLLTDLSSVHGTFVCGHRTTPKLPITLRLNDTFRMGASTRVYKFQWLPYPSEEEEDCPTPKFLQSVYGPNKHECASDGKNKERDLANEKCGQMGAAGSNSWNMECGYSDANEEQVFEEETYDKAVDSPMTGTPILLENVSELDKQERTFFGKNKEQALKEHENVEALVSVPNNTLKTPIYLESASECNKGKGSFASENNEQVLKEHGNVGATELRILNSLESVSDANRQECAFDGENKEKEHGHTEVIEPLLNNPVKIPILLENVSELDKQEPTIFAKNKEHAFKEHETVKFLESVPNNTLKIPIYLESASEFNKGKGSFASENNEQVFKEHGNVGAPELRCLNSLESVSDANRQECAFDGENKELFLKEQSHADVIEPAQNNPVKIPIFIEHVSEPKNQAFAFAGENKERVLKEHGHVEAVESVLSNPVNIPIFMEHVSELKNQTLAFSGEIKEQVLKEHGHVEAVESVLSNRVNTPSFLESISEPNKQEGTCSELENQTLAFSGENKEQVIKEHGHVEAVESVLSNRVNTPSFLENISEPNKQEGTCSELENQTLAFSGENKEHGHVEAVESVLSNRVNTPSFLENISEPNKQEGTCFHENKEQILKECEHVEPVESVANNTIKTPIYMESVPECNKGEGSFPSENKEEALKELGHAEVIEPVPSNPVEIPIFMECVSECKKQVCVHEFAGENKEQVLKEHGHVEAVTFVSINSVKRPVILESASEIIKQECLFANESKEQALEEHGSAEVVEPNPSNPIKTPILLESVPEPNKQECEIANENKEQVIKKQNYFGADTLVPSNLTPILSDAILERNKQESSFDKENMEQTSMKEGDVKVIESEPKNLDQVMLDDFSEPNEQNCEFVDKNKKQFLLEEEYVGLVESVPWKPVQPSAPPLPESQSHLDYFAAVSDADMTLVLENTSCAREKNLGIGASNLWSRRQKDGNLICLQTGRMEMNLKPKKMKENQVKMTKQKRILKENSSAEIILKGKNVRCDKKNRVLGEKKRESILQELLPEISAHGSSSTGFSPDDDDFYPSDKENLTPKVSCQASKTTARKIGRVDQDTHLLQTDTGRAPFQSLSQNSRVNSRPTISSSSKNTNRSMDNHRGLHSEVQMPGVVQHSNLADSKTKWHMVVDTGCLIHDESRQALKQLEGIKGTQLIIPRIVIRELDCLKRQNMSKKGKEAQEFLRWIEECMINKGWWVHVQNSAECFSFGVTPPASPHSNLSGGSNDASASVAFSSYGSFADVLSPTAEDHILECALLYKRLANGGRVVLLSNDVALKVKAMAEGMLCENAKEFCQSLVSPYSERFLWSQSTAHGHNWTDINNSNSRKTLGVTRKLTYFGMMRNSLLRDEEPKKKSNESAKGLKLILLHNSHYGQKHT